MAGDADRPGLLATITTGAAVGLVGVGLLALAVSTWSWRWVWTGTAVLAAAATALNLRWAPALAPAPDRRARWTPPVRFAPALGFAFALFVGATAYLTYATDAAARGGLGGAAGPLVFVLVGLTGLAGLRTGPLTRRVGPARVAVLALLLLGAALALLALGSRALPVVLGSAVAFGAANTVGSAALAIWVARIAPEQPSGALAVALLVGSVGAIGTPAAIGLLVARTGPVAPLLGVAVFCVVVAVTAVPAGRSTPARA
ncbi:hypothetical protein AFB00_27550 [Pseudonocardia sp. HH130630-07]|nr:hypothetical protein AFB00_27550 [Pseudonocardia sp. HH130630-07]